MCLKSLTLTEVDNIKLDCDAIFTRGLTGLDEATGVIGEAGDDGVEFPL
jgi:hypothetical protein